MRDYKTLEGWKLSHALVLDLYRITRKFPTTEQYGLTSQIRRAGASIPANLAEGCGRGGDAELSRFLTIAMGSASELEYHLLLSKDLGLIPTTDYQVLSDNLTRIRRMLNTFNKRVRETIK